MGYELHGHKLDDFTRAYLEAALWTATDENGDNIDDVYDIDDFSAESVAVAVDVCSKFQAENADVLSRGDWSSNEGDYAGHNFWLNRNGHGSGFWDEYDRLPDKADRAALSAECHRYGESYVYVDDDGQLHID